MCARAVRRRSPAPGFARTNPSRGSIPLSGGFRWCHHHTGQGNSFALYDGGWTELVNKNKFGVTGLGTETYNIGILTATQLEN